MPSTNPTASERDALFKTFGRAWFKRDVDLLYQAVAPNFVWLATEAGGRVTTIEGRDAISRAFQAMSASNTRTQFSDVVYHHAPDATFMTFRVVESDKQTGAVLRDEVGVERYTFANGLIAVKDVYRKSSSA